jgi:tetratricopeptide (TPR) repeat protein
MNFPGSWWNKISIPVSRKERGSMTGINEPDQESNAEYWKDLCDAHRAKGNLEDAGRCLDRAISLNPCILNYWKIKEKLSISAGKPREAIFYHVMSDAMIPEPIKYFSVESIPELFCKGLVQYGRHDSQKAADYFRRVAGHGNLPRFVWMILSRLFRDMGLTDETLRCEKYANNPGEGDSFPPGILREKNTQQAGTGPACNGGPDWYDPWFETDNETSRDPELLLNKGVLFYLKHYPEESGQYFDRAFLFGADNPDLYGKLHVAYFKTGNIEKSQICHKKTLDLILREFSSSGQAGPGGASAFENAAMEATALKNLEACSDVRKVAFVGSTLLQGGRYREALPLLIRSTVIDAGLDHRMLLCDCYIHLGDMDKAGDILTAVLSKHPDNVLALVKQAKLFNKIGNFTGALDSAEQGIAGNKDKTAPFFGTSCEQKAYALWKLGRFDEALAAADTWLEYKKEASDDIGAHLQKGIILTSLGRYEEAIPCFDHVLTISPRDLTAWINRGICFRYLRNFDECLRCNNRVLEISPHETTAWENKADCLSEMGRFAECQTCCDQILAHFPGNERAYYLKAQAVFKEKGPDAALPLINQALEFFPKKDNLWVMKGVAVQPHIENKNGKWQIGPGDLDRASEALGYFDEAVRLNPKNGLAQMHKALVLQKTARCRESIAVYDLAIRAEPGILHSWTGKAIVLSELGRLDEAIACCDEALVRCDECLRDDSSRAGVHKLRTIFASMKKEYGEGPIVQSEFYESVPLTPPPQNAGKAVSGPPETPGCSNNGLVTAIRKGRELVLAGQKRESVQWFDDLISRYPASDQLWVEKGVAISAAYHAGTITINNPDDVYEAIRCYEKAIALNPRCIDACIQQGMLYYEMLDFTEAHASLDKALAINPVSVPALKGKAMTYAEAARFTEAVACCDECLRLDKTREDVRRLRDRYAAELKKPGPQRVFEGISFKKQFPESGKARAQPPAPEPSGDVFDADIAGFHHRFMACCTEEGSAKLTVNMERIMALVKENPDLARRYIIKCCSDNSQPLKAWQMIGFIGVAIQMLYNDPAPLDLIQKRAQEPGKK